MHRPAHRKRVRRQNRRIENAKNFGQRCFACRRPKDVCHCNLIPQIDNQLEIVIIQDISERSHPFNTARMVHQALAHSKLIVDYPDKIQRHSRHISPRAGLLFPSKSAIDIADIAPEETPEQLVLLDGTWDQAKRLYRDWPELNRLQHFKITPSQPGNYRIRLEPNPESLSTVEATVAALSHWEPGLENLDQLIRAFETMVDRQLAHPRADYSSFGKTKTPTLNIPASILSHNTQLVVAYGESEPLRQGSPKKFSRTPVYWVAKKLTCGSKFEAAIQSNQPVSEKLLRYFELPPSTFENPISLADFRAMWSSFLDPTELLVVFNHGTLRLLRASEIENNNCLAMRSVNFNPGIQNESLTQFFQKHGVPLVEPDFPGRAGKRLANLITLINHLRTLKPRANETADLPQNRDLSP